ncbi:SRPBCC family protein [uncultured Psychroserpens sp.]|uniref:type II toxin-antitoxin system RatA family toxin n=1 Tax=uncultured Psychroserpens sp. TaxID=255436 RepID=UPI0026277CA7|nr:SRPBCC family protein [uncultured Psychroserpens sp.]
MNTLQKSLTANAVFSSTCGIISILFKNDLERLFGIASNNTFLILGILLLIFALTLVIEVKKQRALSVLCIIIQDLLWVIGSVMLLLFNPFDITTEGHVIIAIVAFVVLQLAFVQARGLARIDEEYTRGLKVIRFSRTVKGTRQHVWDIISDVGNYHQVAPNIDNSKIISGDKKGMVRSCSHGKDSWTETCTLWEDERQYSFEVNTKAPDYPYPLKFLKGTWIVNELTSSESEIVMIFEFEYKKAFQNSLVHPLMKYKFTKVCKELLDNWQHMIEK